MKPAAASWTQYIYMTEQEYELKGQNSSAELIFYHGKLGDVCFHFTLAEGGEEWYAELLKELTALYGEAESTEKPTAIPGKAGSVEHLWENGQNRAAAGQCGLRRKSVCGIEASLQRSGKMVGCAFPRKSNPKRSTSYRMPTARE